MSEHASDRDLGTIVPDWRMLRGRLHLVIKAPDFVTAIDVVGDVSRIAEAQQHHPDIDIRYNRVFLTVWSHDVDRVTDRDLRFAEAVMELVRERGLSTSVPAVNDVEITIDTDDQARIAPFWAALIGGTATDDLVVDRYTRRPRIWFQVSDTPPAARGRVHLDVYVPVDRAEARIAATVEAGGRVVDDAHAPGFTVLADPDGNLACVCTWDGQDDDVEAGSASTPA